MSPMAFPFNFQDAGFPRVSGDEPQRAQLLIFVLGFSPRERG